MIMFKYISEIPIQYLEMSGLSFLLQFAGAFGQAVIPSFLKGSGNLMSLSF